jgi:hypothetical protein
MALNLNKSSDDNHSSKADGTSKKINLSKSEIKKDPEMNSPVAEKKGFNLAKSEDSNTSNVKVDEHHNSEPDTVPVNRDEKPSLKRKKSKVFILVVAICLIAAGVVWHFNSEKIVVEPKEMNTNASVAPTDGAPAPTIKATAADVEQTDSIAPVASQSSGLPQDQSTDGSTQPAKDVTTAVNKSDASSIPVVSSVGSTSGSIEDKAKRAISGVFGNGADRRKALGDEYEAIQAKVNEMYKNGLIE